MIAYVDTSVLLRVALGQADALPEWRQVDRGVTSALTSVEGLRTLDRLRLRARLADAEVARRRAIILQLLDSTAPTAAATSALPRMRSYSDGRSEWRTSRKRARDCRVR